MAIATEITLEMLIKEMERIRVHMVTSYPDMVRDGRITPYQRDDRLNCNKATLTILRQLALHYKNEATPLSTILNSLQP